MVSDQWRLFSGILCARGWLSQYTWDQRLYMVSELRETHSPKLKARFLHLTILVAAGIKPQTFWLPGQRVTTWPRLSVCYNTIQFSYLYSAKWTEKGYHWSLCLGLCHVSVLPRVITCTVFVSTTSVLTLSLNHHMLLSYQKAILFSVDTI